ncbi:actin-like ATPase domain-containing protein [Neurospora crassa]|uniref:Phosphotransferase n=2 Tax=Neurospora crassa TaxID=5141 RepID=Q7S6H6_NEUCR|nr:hexokinase-1 [Neurospora crassa OR74A]EAA31127.1 hexokinase-1 [Neurospora crassa OR74A]KHE83305.1 actin-like ATPase domain-containing protein [Neurospora crassa]CAE85550.1 related to hexokinase [Neurospora crassa]|eukprot:XP_960363.1 hexokinase-1 [Neurospora crassa OR74A]
MASLKLLIINALKSLSRGRSFLQALLALWISPKSNPNKLKKIKVFRRTREEFLKEAKKLLLGPIGSNHFIKNSGPTPDDPLLLLSKKLEAQFRQGLQTSPACMLPSYNHQLPGGHESGQYLAVDIGGSTLRVGVVDLKGRQTTDDDDSTIVHMDSYKIDRNVRLLRGAFFFKWMARKVETSLKKAIDAGHISKAEYELGNPMPMGLAWSFPLEQTSPNGGNICPMGKSFLACDGLMGQDLGATCNKILQELRVNVEVVSIVNDSNATLLSSAYSSPSARFGLILGTGVNIAAHLPVNLIGKSKFGERPDSWYEQASHVMVNTELGMFGRDILPLTRWDKILKAGHERPDFQPLEHLVSGYYLGEVFRIALLEAIKTTGLLGGKIPPLLLDAYSMDTGTMSLIINGRDARGKAEAVFSQLYHLPAGYPSTEDMRFMQQLAGYIAQRSASIVAASVFALWELKNEAEQNVLNNLEPESPFSEETALELMMEQTTVGYTGSVLECFPGYKETLQRYLDQLMMSSGHDLKGRRIDLVPAKESSLLGAAVSLAGVVEEERMGLNEKKGIA